MSATSAMAATTQGMALPTPDVVRAEALPAGVPQRWQKRAPGVIGTSQLPQVAPASAVPQLEQKRPVAEAPQEGQAPETAGSEGVVTLAR